jgi:hypothetical protein
MKKEYKPANAEFRECVLMHKLGQINLPRFTGIPSPDDMAYEPTPLGYRSTYLYHHNVVAASEVDIEGYQVKGSRVDLSGTITTWALEEDGSRGHQVSPLKMSLPVTAFEAIDL